MWKLSKRLLVTLAIIIAIVLLTAFLVNSLITNDNKLSYEAQAEKIYNDAIDEVQSLRGVILPHLPLIVITEDQAVKLWGGGSYTPDYVGIRRDENIYKGLFMMKENESLYQAQTDWVGAWIAVTWNNSIYVVTKYFNPYYTVNAESTLVHELTHVMQGTLKVPEQVYSSFDADKARGAMIEGDAVYTQDFFTNNNKPPTVNVNHILAGLQAIQPTNAMLSDAHASIPASISELNYFPYTYGDAFISQLYTLGGWSEVNQVYKNPPNTTQQILHTDKYLQGINPSPPAAPTLNQEGWNQISNNTYGEYFIRNMLNTWLTLNESKTAVVDWNGDNLTYYEDQNNNFLYTWNINWASPSTATDFISAFQNMVHAAGGTSDYQGIYSANGRYLTITWNGTNSTLIACSSSKTSVEKSNFNQQQETTL